MAKKKNITRDSQVNKPVAMKPIANEPELCDEERYPSIHSVTLTIGVWKKHFPELQYRIIIAQAMNVCIRKGDLTVVGYIITEKRVCLVLKMDKKDIYQTLQTFYNSVKREIREYREWMESRNLIRDNKGRFVKIDDPHSELFIQYPFCNENLKRLITGRQVRLSYYNPSLERLRDLVHKNNFCSVQDYAGAKGPVKVTQMTEEEWKKEHFKIHGEKRKENY